MPDCTDRPIDRRAFLRSTAASLAIPVAGSGVRAPAARAARARADLLLRGARVYDGTGRAPFEADVRVAGDRIVEVARSLPAARGETVDLRGLALAPGFIDIHSHTDTVLLSFPRAESKVRQGVTTEVAGQDGSSVAPSSPDRVARLREQYARDIGIDVDMSRLGGFFRAIEAAGSAVNLASMVGAGTIRGLVIGDADRPPTDVELDRMVQHVRMALADGACGLSSGLEYVPGGFATTHELAALAGPLRGTGLPYASHMRNEDDHLLGAIEEALALGRMAGVPVQMSHLKVQGGRNWWKIDAVLDTIETARAAGIDVRFDRYPYIAYSTGLSNLFPLWARDGGTTAFIDRLRDPAVLPRIEASVRDKIDQLGSWDAVQVTSTANGELAWARGRRLGQLATERATEPFSLLLEITFADQNRTGMVGFGMSEANTQRILSHPLGMICSDGSALAVDGPLARGSPHPRSFGTFPRVLGHYCRDHGAMPLETAIHKMTGMPAAKLRLIDRGRITAGAFADLVAFDPATVGDRATFEQPFQYPAGIEWVIVNGEIAVREGEHTGALAGRVLRSDVRSGAGHGPADGTPQRPGSNGASTT
ncbi:MAG: D-aminoacylase, partial [Gemmatimonadetes bacterium]|nr:D-aminoacylase [Gemmatimonadota bacterium]